MAHIRQTRPDSGLGFPVKVVKLLQVVPALRALEQPYAYGLTAVLEGKEGGRFRMSEVSLYSATLDFEGW